MISQRESNPKLICILSVSHPMLYGCAMTPITTKRSRRKKQAPLHFTATCAFGLEALAEKEISSYGGCDIATSPGAITWTSQTLEPAYRACLWSRFCNRILFTLSEFEAQDPDDLYKNARQIDWEAHFDVKATFAVHATLVKAKLNHSQFASLRIKDAVADWFREHIGKRPNVDPRAANIRIHLHVQETEARLSLDLSGDSLHIRGYRKAAAIAPLKETLAAAIVHLAGWRGDIPGDFVLLDPMCGSGTLLIEAALIFGDSAPGLQRKYFGFSAWRKHNKKLWEQLVQEALEREDLALEKNWPQIIGYDADPQAVAAARKNVAAAGLKDRIIIKQRQLAELECPHKNGMLLTNPPYGERLSEKEAVKYLYKFLGRRFCEKFPGWQLAFFTANADFADMLGVLWQERFRLYNGPLKCSLFCGTEPRFPQSIGEHDDRFNWQPADDVLPDNPLANRLRKNCRTLLPWAAQNRITCFRIYDADIPEYNLTVDLLEEWVHVQEYAAPKEIEGSKAKERFNESLDVIRQVLQVPHSRLFIKTRQKQKGKAQYQKRPGQGKLYEVREGSARFLLNFTDYLDTGLFLDHRPTRHMIAELAKGKTFLNLYAYTGSATVHAALGGAIATTTVDVSEPYLMRARSNMSLNGIGGSQHRFEQADVMSWLAKCKERFGLIFVDPPTFSNNRHKKTTFEVQRDHEHLLRLAMERLSQNGLLIFSNNFKKFKLSPILEKEFLVKDITRQTIPRDFRNKSVHCCWEFRHLSQVG